MAVELIYTNSNGGSVTFGGSAPYLYQNHSGFGGPKNNIYTVKSPNQDGESFVGSDLDKRQLTIDGSIIANTDDLQPYRRELTQVFNPKLSGELEYINGDFDTKIDCQVDTPPTWADDDYDGEQSFSVILLCPSPFFKALEQQRTEIAAWTGGIEFPLDIPEDGIEFEVRSPSLIVNVNNPGDVECGMKVVFTALAELTNPSVVNVNTQESIKIKADMQQGDKIVVTTGYGSNKVELIRAGVTTSAMNLLDILNSTLPFMKLQPGDNLIRYAAATNQDNLQCVVYNTPQYLGG
jgi:hypothetical protein